MLMRSGEKRTEFTCLFRVLSTYNARFVALYAMQFCVRERVTSMLMQSKDEGWCASPWRYLILLKSDLKEDELLLKGMCNGR